MTKVALVAATAIAITLCAGCGAGETRTVEAEAVPPAAEGAGTETPVQTETAPESAEPGDTLAVAFIARAKKYDDFTQKYEPKTPGDVVLAMRIEGATREEVKAEQRPRIEFDGVTNTASVMQTSGSRTTTTPDGESVTIAPFLFLLFAVSEEATEVTLVIDNHQPLTVSVPDQISEKLTSADIR